MMRTPVASKNAFAIAAATGAVGGSPEQAAHFLDDEVAKWAKVISAAAVKAE